MKKMPVTKKTFDSHIELHRSSGNSAGQPWTFRVHDANSNSLVVDVTFSDEDFAHLVSGRYLGHDGGERLCTLYVSDRIGKTEEYERVYVEIPPDEWEHRDRIVYSFMNTTTAPSEGTWLEDGWEYDTLPEHPNGHKWRRPGHLYEVFMRRYV